MKNPTNQLLLDKTQEKLLSFTTLKSSEHPKEGWVKTIRQSIKMSFRQLGNRLQMTPQGVRNLEKREEEGSITINSLKEVGRALEMDLVYGFISRHHNLEEMIEKRATEIATEIVNKTHQTMKLENQAISNKKIEKAIQQKTYEISSEMPSYLWD